MLVRTADGVAASEPRSRVPGCAPWPCAAPHGCGGASRPERARAGRFESGVGPGLGRQVRESGLDEARAERSTVRVKPRSAKAVKGKRTKPEDDGGAVLLTGADAQGASSAARAIAAELGKQVRRTSLAKVVGRYAGETERNLARVLTRASQLDIVLILDEAEALFGKRTAVRSASERYANMQRNFLLRALQNHRGFLVVTAKSEGDLHPEFLRCFAPLTEPPPETSRKPARGSKPVKAPRKPVPKPAPRKATKPLRPKQPAKARAKPGSGRARARRR